MLAEASERGRDAHLSLRWELRNGWEAASSALGVPKATDTLPAVALALCMEAVDRGRWVSYSRRAVHYSVPRRYRSRLYTYRRVTSAVDQLDDLGLIENEKSEPGQLGRQSRMRANEELVHLLQPALKDDVALRAPSETVVLRDSDRHLLDYADSRETHRMRRQVEEQNQALRSAQIYGQGLLQVAAPLRRIFNTGFQLGGRFYALGGGWQTLNKEARLLLQIDGEPVVEVDYAQFHPALAYATSGHIAPPDAYDVAGFDRELVKVAFAVMLNSGSQNGARYTIAHKPQLLGLVLGIKASESRWSEGVLRPGGALPAGCARAASRKAQDLIDTLLKVHAPIAAMFFKGAGLWLQCWDSRIAEVVMREMRRRGIVVLSVHDSFIAPRSKAVDLEAVMTETAARAGVAVSCRTFSASSNA